MYLRARQGQRAPDNGIGPGSLTLYAEELAELECSSAHLGELAYEAFEVVPTEQQRRTSCLRRPLRCSPPHGLSSHAPTETRRQTCGPERRDECEGGAGELS